MKHPPPVSILTVALLATLLSASAARSQSVDGLVVDDLGTGPIAGALVVLLDSAGSEFARVRTSPSGAFSLPLGDITRFRLWATATGYEQILSGSLAQRRGTPIVEIRLTPRPVALAPIAVAVEAQGLTLARTGFYARQQMGIGRFITADAIEERRALRVSDALVMEPSVRTLIDFGGDGATGAVVTFRGAVRGLRGGSAGPCLPTIVLDGVKVRDSGVMPPPPGTDSSGSDSRRPIRLDELIHPSNIAGIELYPSGAGAPVQWSGMDAGCGLIVVWSKRRHS